MSPVNTEGSFESVKYIELGCTTHLPVTTFGLANFVWKYIIELGYITTNPHKSLYLKRPNSSAHRTPQSEHLEYSILDLILMRIFMIWVCMKSTVRPHVALANCKLQPDQLPLEELQQVGSTRSSPGKALSKGCFYSGMILKCFYQDFSRRNYLYRELSEGAVAQSSRL